MKPRFMNLSDAKEMIENQRWWYSYFVWVCLFCLCLAYILFIFNCEDCMRLIIILCFSAIVSLGCAILSLIECRFAWGSRNEIIVFLLFDGYGHVFYRAEL